MRDAEYDLVIIGSGAGGLAAAVAARLAGMRVLVVEKTGLLGGSTSLSGGNLWLPNNPLMARDGVRDSREDALRYLAQFAEAGDPATTLERQQAFVDAVAPMVTLFAGEGMIYERSPGFPDNYDHLPGGHAMGRTLRAALFNANRLGSWKAKLRPPSMPLPVHASEGGVMLQALHSWKGRAMVARVLGRVLAAKLTGRTIHGTGAALQGRMLEIALRLGVDIWLDAPLVALDMQGGAVTGAVIERDGERQTIRATRGVVMAAAGFARNLAMRQKYLPAPTTTDWTLASPGETGDAILALEQAGAGFAWMGEGIWLTSWITGASQRPVMSELAKPHGMLVDAAGQRFVNEGRPSNEIGRACYQRQHGVPAWFVADARARKRYVFAFNLPGRVSPKWLEQGWVCQDQTIAGLAGQCGIDPAGLEASVARFNQLCAAGDDADFHRGDSAYSRAMGDPASWPNVNLGPIAQPPFWAAPIVPGDVGTYGGAITDRHARVLRGDGSVICGLYAAGNCAAPLAGPHYPGAGFSIAVAAVSGYLAARHAAGNHAA